MPCVSGLRHRRAAVFLLSRLGATASDSPASVWGPSFSCLAEQVQVRLAKGSDGGFGVMGSNPSYHAEEVRGLVAPGA